MMHTQSLSTGTEETVIPNAEAPSAKRPGGRVLSRFSMCLALRAGLRCAIVASRAISATKVDRLRLDCFAPSLAWVLVGCPCPLSPTQLTSPPARKRKLNSPPNFDQNFVYPARALIMHLLAQLPDHPPILHQSNPIRQSTNPLPPLPSQRTIRLGECTVMPTSLDSWNALRRDRIASIPIWGGWYEGPSLPPLTCATLVTSPQATLIRE